MPYVESIFITVAVTVTIFAAEHFLASLKNWVFGGILPIVFLLFSIWCFLIRTPRLSTEALFPFMILFLAIVSSWAEARENRKKKLKKELESMQAQDLRK